MLIILSYPRNIHEFFDMNNNGQHLSSNLSRSRIDSSTPKSFYCSPKSYHYIPFAQRRSQLANFGRQTGVKNCQDRLWSQLSEQRGSCLFTKRDTSNKDSPMSSTSFKATFPNTSSTNRSVQSRNNQLQVPNQQQSKEFISIENSNLSQSKIQSQTSGCVYGNYDDEMRGKLDQFKNEILDDIIQRGVYTDSVIQDCISRSVADNSTLTMASLQQAITELLTDIGVMSIKVNKKAWKANSDFSEPADEVLNYENEEFESDEGESLSAIPSVESCSDKLAEEDKSPASNFGSLSITDSLTTLSNSSVTDTSN